MYIIPNVQHLMRLVHKLFDITQHLEADISDCLQDQAIIIAELLVFYVKAIPSIISFNPALCKECNEFVGTEV